MNRVSEGVSVRFNTNRLIAGFAAFVMIISVLPMAAFAAEPDIQIGTLSELLDFSAEVNGGNTYEGKTVVLTADIALGGEVSPWTPIGTSANPFKGTFDGGNHVVSGLYIASGPDVGFFGFVSGGNIRNLVVDGSVSGSSNVAGIVGYLDGGKISSCGNRADVGGGSAVGGVAGYLNGACTVSGCYNSGNITGTTGYIGGVTGQHWRAGEVTNCYNVGTVEGPATVGGVSGGHKAASGTVLTNCYNAGKVINSAASANNHGSVLGGKGTAENCYDLSGSEFRGVGYLGTDVNSVTSLEATALGSAFADDIDGLNSGYPVLKWQTRVPDLIITTYEQFKAFADEVNGGNTFEGKLVRLDVNLYLGGRNNPWTPVGTKSNKFCGTFDGGYHVISGLYIASGSNVGLFGYVSGGTVRNLVAEGSVSGSSNAAGIVGYLDGGKISSCGNRADVGGGSAVGGVAGYLNGACTVSGCYNSGSISGTTGYIGGVTGQHWRAGEVTDCYNIGTVEGPATVGGVSGGHKAASAVLDNCYNAGSVVDSKNSNNNIGAVVGASRGKNTNCFYIKGTGTDSKAGITGVESISASDLSSAFADGETYPVLAWEGSVCTDAPVRPAFVESSELSARLAGYIRAAVNSTKVHSEITGTLLGNEGYMAGASSTATDWMALAMGRFGYFDEGDYSFLVDDGTGYEDYLAAMKAYIERIYAANRGILHSAKATEWHRAVVAIAALCGDPTDSGRYNGKPIDLIADGSYNNALKAGPGTQGINGWIWGLISMDTGMYEVPADAKYTRERFITEILKMQLTDGVNGSEYGGWVLGGYGSRSDVDITAMAVQALAPYYNDETVYTYTNGNSKKEVSKTVRQCVDEALDRLGSMLNGNAGFSSWNTNNAESISQVIVALCSLGIDPAKDGRFITSDGKTLLDGLLLFRLPDGGFCHVLNGGWNSMANDQAAYALVSYWRLENGMRALYDMRGDWTAEEKSAIQAAIAAIGSVSDPSAPDYKAQLKAALAAFRAVDADERRYVSNYSVLASAIGLVGGESALDTDAPYITSISVTKKPDRTRYYVGDRFDPAGMVITAVYSDGRTETITGYRVSATGELGLSDDTVFITYGVLRTSVSVEVREKMPWDGEGTKDDPYLIKTPDDLVDLRYYIASKNLKTADVYFRMTRDINMKNITDWKAIADNAAGGFRGHFDGSGYSIWNLNGSTYNCCGLFGRLGDGAVIENLTIASGNLGGSYNFSIGAIAGEVVADAVVTIRNCRSFATVTGNFGIGGILGQIEERATAIVENCSNHGTVIASRTGGGIIGQVGPNRWKNNGAKAEVTNCYNAGKITGSGTWGLGGIVGSCRLGGADVVNTITNCYNAGTVAASAASGAIFGSAAETAVKLDNVYHLDSTNQNVNGIFTDDGDDKEGTLVGTAAAKTDAEMKADAFVTLLGNAFAKDSGSINSGYPILNGQKARGEEAPVHAGLEIGTAEELKNFAVRVNAGESFKNKTVLLTAHIDLSKYPDWTPIGRYESRQFDGIFDGQGYVIDNLYSKSGGLFGYVGTNAVIKNVGVASGEIGASNLSFMGGIAKWSNGADIINCWNGADIYCSGWSGGIVGTVRDGGKSIIRGCFNIGSVSASDGAVGGIVGHLSASGNGTDVSVLVADCYNAGTITAADNAGGIVGRVQAGHTIKNCYNAGAVTVNGVNILDGAGAIASLVTGRDVIINCYYDSGIVPCGVSNGEDAATGKKTAEMKSDEFLALLGAGFRADRYALVNNGYPLLVWQKTEDADETDDVIAKIDSIGTVTLESESTIKEARSAYDGLSDELKELVENYDRLVKAEKDLSGLKKAGEIVTPDTGDNAHVPVYVLLSVGCICAAAAFRGKNKRRV